MKDKEFFDSAAAKWDDICCHPPEKIQYVLEKADMKKGGRVLDIGSGTGVTIPFIEKTIGDKGHITALDIAEKMIEISKKKNKYDNIEFVVEDYYSYKDINYSNNGNLFDRIVAYSCYPHFKNKKNFYIKSNSLLKIGGKLLIAHIESREAINNMHGEINKIQSDKLMPIEETITIAEKYGFEMEYKEDNKEYYICTLKKIRDYN